MASSELHDVVSTKAKLPDTLSRCCLDGINIAMLTLTFLVFAIRFILRVMGKKAGEAQDILSYIAYVCYVLMVVMYLENDPLYRAESVLRGERPAYQGLREYFVLSFLSQLDGVQPTRGLAVVHDAGMVHRWMTAGQLLFYACLTFWLDMHCKQAKPEFVNHSSTDFVIQYQLFATLRVVQVSTNNGIPKIPDPKWLQMWTTIKTSMAVMIGCGPAFNALCRQSRAQNARRYPISLEDIKKPDLTTRSNGETSQI
ncbi:hypothetical protein GGP41_001829 [Bipolaris sorokiniana]|uniref:Uncharacterized protein n=1 Tax=Cochliobolus sativus TaxID=45130 RepID=A0A8H6E0C4_COCSA|nr:hypothetical protein GGP41_001829 [Bipolaris sorokiniana]